MSDAKRPRPPVNPELARRLLEAARQGPPPTPVPAPAPDEQVVETPPSAPDPPPVYTGERAIREQAAALHQQAVREIQAGATAQAQAHLAESLALERGIAFPADTAATLVMLGQLLFGQNERDTGLAMARESLAIFTELGAPEVQPVGEIVAQMEALLRQDAPGGSRDLLRQGIAAMQSGDGEAAGNLLDTSLQQAISDGDGAVAAGALHHLGLLLFSAGHLPEAAGALRDSIELNRTLDDPPSLAAGLALLGQILVAQGERAEGLRVLRESLLTWNAAGLREQAAQVKTLIAELRAEAQQA